MDSPKMIEELWTEQTALDEVMLIMERLVPVPRLKRRRRALRGMLAAGAKRPGRPPGSKNKSRIPVPTLDALDVLRLFSCWGNLDQCQGDLSTAREAVGLRSAIIEKDLIRSEREDRILQMTKRVNFLARRRKRITHSSVTLDELMSAAWVGAIKAVDGHQPRGMTLAAYAVRRINGEMLDYLRGLDCVSQRHRVKIKAGEEPEILSFSMDHLPQEQFSAWTHISDICPAHSHLAVEASIDLSRLCSRAKIRPRDYEVLKRVLDGERQCVVADSIGVSPGRISQICTDVTAKLRAAATSRATEIAA